LAILISLALHAAFLLIYIPQKLLDKPVEIDTFAVGVVEMPFGKAVGGPQALIAAVSPAGLKDKTLPKTSVPASGKPNAALTKPSQTSEGTGKEKPADPLVVSPDPNQSKPSKSALPQAGDNDQPVSAEKDGNGAKNGDGKGTGDSSGPGKGNGGPGGPGGPGTEPFVATGLGTGEQMSSGSGGGFPYPKNLLNEGKEGDVEVKLLIKADGSMEGYEVVHSSGDSRLVKSVKSYIERQLGKLWKPYNQNYYVIILFTFRASSGNVKITLEKSETRP